MIRIRVKAWNKLPLEEDIKALGTHTLKESKDDEWYIDIATFSEYRGQGIATKLFNYLISTPDRKWSLSCDYDNPRAKKLYERLGF